MYAHQKAHAAAVPSPRLEEREGRGREGRGQLVRTLARGPPSDERRTDDMEMSKTRPFLLLMEKRNEQRRNGRKGGGQTVSFAVTPIRWTQEREED